MQELYQNIEARLVKKILQFMFNLCIIKILEYIIVLLNKKMKNEKKLF